MKEEILSNQKGITLIALVVTIIVLLILAGVSIVTLTGDNGIITKANDVKIETSKAEAKEKILIETIASYNKNGNLDVANLKNNLKNNLGLEVTGDVFPLILTVDGYEFVVYESGEVLVKESREGLKVGDYINYEPDLTSASTYSKDKLTESYTGYANTKDIKQDTLDWQILKIYDDGSMDLIGSPTTQAIYFQGARGYNNGVYILNDICKTLYSREGIEARSVNIEDFESNLTEVGKATKTTYINNQVTSLSVGDYISSIDTTNNTVTYVKSRAYYPMLYKEEQNNGIGRSDKYYTKDTLITTDGNGISYEQVETLTIPYTYYYIPINSTYYGEASKVLISGAGNSFWLASRYVGCKSSFAHFGLYRASTYCNGNSLLYSAGNPDNHSYRLRPVVQLGSDVLITTSATATNSSTPHEITKY